MNKKVSKAIAISLATLSVGSAASMVGCKNSTGGVLGATLLAVLFAFEGWTNVGAIAGEMKNPGRDLPRAIVGGVSIIMAVYFTVKLM